MIVKNPSQTKKHQPTHALRLLARDQIDAPKWNVCVARSANETPLGYTQALDFIAPGWQGVIVDDYEGVMPLPVSKTMGTLLVQMPPEVQNLGLFSANQDIIALLGSIFQQPALKKFRFITYSATASTILKSASPYLNYRNTNELNLNEPFNTLYDRYSASHKKNLRRFSRQNLTIEKNQHPHAYASLKEAFARIRPEVFVPKAHFERFNKLVAATIKEGSGEIYTVSRDGQVLGAAFFITGKKRSVVFHSTNPEGKQLKTTFALINHFIQQHAQQDLILDFAGSDIESIAQFNLGFGAIAKKYPTLSINRLPPLFRIAKKMRIKHRAQRFFSKKTTPFNRK